MNILCYLLCAAAQLLQEIMSYIHSQFNNYLATGLHVVLSEFMWLQTLYIQVPLCGMMMHMHKHVCTYMLCNDDMALFLYSMNVHYYYYRCAMLEYPLEVVIQCSHKQHHLWFPPIIHNNPLWFPHVSPIFKLLLCEITPSIYYKQCTLLSSFSTYTYL